MNYRQNILDRFIRYVKIETTSDENAKTIPSTKTQLAFAKILAEEMKDIGIKNVKTGPYGHVTGEIPSNVKQKTPVIGFLAHMDTYHAFSGKNVRPQIIRNYKGGKIRINKDMYIDPARDHNLKLCKGHDLVTTDGTTLLGGDDKAGIAIIMTMAEYFINNPSVNHGTVKVAFTPDEEIAKNIIEKFDLKAFGADFAYTVDGDKFYHGATGNFNADGVTIKISGVNTHLGAAKGVMVNPVNIAADIINSWPKEHRPETTEKEKGFVCFISSAGSLEGATVTGLAREHDLKKLAALENLLKKIVKQKEKQYKGSKISLEIKPQYRNMKNLFDKNPEPVERMKRAFKKCGLKPDFMQIRGGTDGARLAFLGLPTPDVFAGYSGEHGPYEYASVNAMEKSFEIIRAIAVIE